MLRPMSEAADPALIGRRVAGKFVVEQFLGGGAMGAVYRARDDSLERLVALKVMHPSMAVDPTFVSRFHREARAASRLDHPSSMRVIEFGEEPDGLLYIAMEYLEGRDLYKVIHEDWPLSDARIADIMMKALGAIAVAHDMGVIHRDLKPENIMILNRKDDEGSDLVKVCDFGIAKITEKDEGAPSGATPKTAGPKVTTAGLVVGTPEYMSPEQARGEKLDARSDIYSMGIILYQLLTGRTPFLAETALAVVLKHITDPPEPPRTIYPGVHPGLEAVCMRAIVKDKEQRWKGARAMRAALKAAIEGRPMPIDSNAVTAVDPASAPSLEAAAKHESGAISGAHASAASTRDASEKSAPAPGMPRVTSNVTPLVTALTDSEPKRSRAPMFIGATLAVLVIGGASVVRTHKDDGATAQPPPTITTATASAPAKALDRPAKTTMPSVPSASANAATTAPDTKGAKLAPSSASHAAPPEPPAAKATSAAREVKPLPVPTATTTVNTNEAPSPAPLPAPLPEPQPTATAKPEPAPIPPPPLPAPAWSPVTCHATLGPPRSASGYNAKDLTLRGTDAAWSTCAKSAIREKPAAPISGTVRIRFNDNKVFRGATCTGCTPALAQCVASSTGKTATVTFKSGDVTGDPEFDVPVTFSCE